MREGRFTTEDYLQIGWRLDRRIACVIARAGSERSDRRSRWDKSVTDARMSYRRVHDYTSPAIMEAGMVKRQVHGMLQTVIEARLLTIFAETMVRLERVQTSIEIIKILASPSGRAGPEAYAPKSFKEAIYISRPTL